MEYRVLETRSADILTKYYSNEIDSFLNACHEDILWICLCAVMKIIL